MSSQPSKSSKGIQEEGKGQHSSCTIAQKLVPYKKQTKGQKWQPPTTFSFPTLQKGTAWVLDPSATLRQSLFWDGKMWQWWSIKGISSCSLSITWSCESGKCSEQCQNKSQNRGLISADRSNKGYSTTYNTTFHIQVVYKRFIPLTVCLSLTHQCQ